MKDVCRGIVWLHNAHPPMLHGDIKAYAICLLNFFIVHAYPASSCRMNVLVDGNFQVKLGDFGFTKEMPTLSGTITLKTVHGMARPLGILLQRWIRADIL